MKRKAKELQKQRQDAGKTGRSTGYSGISSSSSSGGRGDVQVMDSMVEKPKPTYMPPV